MRKGTRKVEITSRENGKVTARVDFGPSYRTDEREIEFEDYGNIGLAQDAALGKTRGGSKVHEVTLKLWMNEDGTARSVTLVPILNRRGYFVGWNDEG